MFLPCDSRSLESPEIGGQCLAVIYPNIVALNTRLSTRYVRRHPSKKINAKTLPEKPFQMPPIVSFRQFSDW